MILTVDLSWCARYYPDPDAVNRVIDHLYDAQGITRVVGIAPGRDIGSLRRRIEPEWREVAPDAEQQLRIDALVELFASQGASVYDVGPGDIVDGLANHAFCEPDPNQPGGGGLLIMSGRKRARFLPPWPRFDGRSMIDAPTIGRHEIDVAALTEKPSPGVGGLGPKRALKLVEHFGDLRTAWQQIATRALDIPQIDGVPMGVMLEIVARLPRISRWVELYQPWSDVVLRRVA